MADTKITDLTALTSAADADIIPIVDDPSGTPVTKKITKANLLTGQVAKSTLSAKGNILAASAAATPAGLTVGSDGQILKAASGQSEGLQWVDNEASIQFLVDGGGSVIETGEKGHIEVPFACEIQRVTLLADQSGSIQIDIWKDTYDFFPPTNGDSITSSAVPAISAATKYQDATLTGWTTTLAKGDILAFNVDSVTSITRCTVALLVNKT